MEQHSLITYPPVDLTGNEHTIDTFVYLKLRNKMASDCSAYIYKKLKLLVENKNNMPLNIYVSEHAAICAESGRASLHMTEMATLLRIFTEENVGHEETIYEIPS